MMTGDGAYKVLFLCARNSARSIFAEAILNRVGRGRFQAFSAGAEPATELHPRAVTVLQAFNFDPSQLRPKDWSDFAGPDAPALDFVITVCDRAAQAACPSWSGDPLTAHWGLPDPAEAQGTDTEQALAFTEAYRYLNNRIGAFANLPLDTLDRLALKRRLQEIGDEPGSGRALAS